ncbi:hydrogenase expression protein HypA [[Kitasatospora] papulosa]|uniref:hydrogenase expression protein HypA n=1 Tax=[Kitasatospora] papulosa TaxID=1464011 RepID=UPI002E0EDAB6|nr:hydrogenase expression protein HypA [[Kitasatospora] papulosa]
MAREHDPSSPVPPSPGTSSGAFDASGTSPAPVRPTVPAQEAAGDSGGVPGPGDRRGDTSSAGTGPDAGGRLTSEGAGNEAQEGADTRARTAGRAAAAEAAAPAPGAGAARGVGAPEPSPKEVPGPSTADSGATTVASAASASGPAAAHTATGAAVAVATVAGGGGAGTRTAGELLGSRPRKSVLAAAAVVGALLVSVPFLVMGQDDRKPEKDLTQNAAGTVLGAERSEQPEAYTSKSPSPSATPSKEKEKEKPAVQPAPEPVEASPSVKPESKPEPKPTPKATAAARVAAAPANTAASALSGLAASDPEGRHICYRAFVSGSGWQTPVCDGTMAGTAGQGKRITALNIAVWNVGGSSANALLHDPGSTSGNAKWAPSWTATIADGKNNYIGSSKSGAPFLTGFAMNVGKGSVCHTAKMGDGGWGPQYCKNGRPEYMFVGTTDNKRWFEAVKLTV